jgi:DNA invertase Pin-like site-specific DNA recombinase
MLTVAYVRVSTDEQAAEGFSIEGQAEKLRAYATLHDLGPVTVIEDPGWSGKNMDRPGLQQVLDMVTQGHVTSVLVWRLDRLSRNLGDLILLAETFGEAGVVLHSFCERIDLSSATGRMFYNVLGSFAQFYREQLAENVKMGMAQAVREGKWINRPKTGYDMVNGELVPTARLRSCARRSACGRKARVKATSPEPPGSATRRCAPSCGPGSTWARCSYAGSGLRDAMRRSSRPRSSRRPTEDA